MLIFFIASIIQWIINSIKYEIRKIISPYLILTNCKYHFEGYKLCGHAFATCHMVLGGSKNIDPSSLDYGNRNE